MIEILFVVGIILFMGFFAELLFRRTRISPVLLLISLGFLIGPVFGVVDSSTTSALIKFIPLVSAIALIILLFDGGINLNFFDLITVFPRATAFTLLTFILSVVATAFLCNAFLGWSMLHGLLLGATLGGTSSAIVISLVQNSSASKESKSLLVLESTLTDALSVLTAFIVIQIISSEKEVTLNMVMNLLFSSFSIALVFGALASILWLLVLRRLGHDSFPYMLTLATVFVLYSIVEASQASGGIAVFLFGLILGNAGRITEKVSAFGKWTLSSEISSFQEEVTFFTRTFFFVFLGLVINLKGISEVLLVLSIAFIIVFLLIRWIGCKLCVPKSIEKRFIISMLPRGLAAAVLAGLPAEKGISLPGFIELTFVVIILTNVVATIGIFFSKGTSLGASNPSGPKVVSIK